MLCSFDAFSEIRRHLDSIGRAAPYSVLVHGAPGLGRSWLVDRTFAAARHQQVAAISCSGLRCDADRSLISQLMEQLPGEPADRASWPDVQSAVGQHVERAPLLITVDDLQAGDQPSVEAVLDLPWRIRHPNLMVVLTDSGNALPTERAWPFPRLELGPLEDSYACELAASQFGERATAELIDRVVQQSGGNPRLLTALVHDFCAARIAVAGTSGVGHKYGQALLDCLSRQPVAATVAAAVAVVGEAPRDVIGAVAGQSRLLASLHLLVSTGVLDTDLRFRHPDAAELILETLDPAERAQLHDRAAACLSEGGASTQRIAEHLVRGSSNAPDWALEVLLDAAQQAAIQERPNEQIAFLRKASQIAEDRPEHRFDVLARLARAEWRLNPSAAGRYLTTLQQALDPQAGDPQLLSGVIRHLFWHGEFDRAAEALTEYARQPDPDRGRRIELQFIQQWLRFTLPGQARQLAPVFAAALPDGDPRLLAGLSAKARAADLLALLMAGGENRVAVQHQAEIMAVRPPEGDSYEVSSAVIAALVLAQYQSVATRWCERLLVELEESGAPGWCTAFLAHRADLALAEGDAAEGYRLAMRALQAMSTRAWGIGIGQPLATALEAASRLGYHAEAAHLLAWPVPKAMMASRYGFCYLRARGRHYLAAGQPSSALADFRTCGRMLADWGCNHSQLLSWRLDAAQALVRMGRTEEARRLATEQLRLVGDQPSPVRVAGLRTLAELVSGSERTDLLTEAFRIERSERSGVARLPADSRPRPVPRPGPPAPPRLLRAVGQPAGRTRGPAGRDQGLTTAHADGGAALSEAERRVAVLAASGHSNRQIAEQLYITVSTVEQHLTRIYRKLGVRRRDALAAVLERKAAASEAGVQRAVGEGTTLDRRGQF